MANPFLARLLDTQQRGLQAERERQMRNDAFGNLGFLGQSLQRSFQPLAEMQQREDLQKQSQQFEADQLRLRNQLEQEKFTKPITEQFPVRDEDGVTRFSTREILFDKDGRRTTDPSKGRPMTQAQLENIYEGQRVTATEVGRMSAPFQGEVEIDGETFNFTDANRVALTKDIEAKIKAGATAEGQEIDNPYFVSEQVTPNEKPKITIRKFLDKVKKTEKSIDVEAEKELITARGQETRGQMSIANRYARQNKILDLALDKRRYAEITKPKLYQELLLKKDFAKFANNQELAQKFAELGQKLESGEVTVDGKGLQDFIRENKIEDLNAELDITNKDAAQKLGLSYDAENGGFFEEVMDPATGRIVPMPVVFEEVKNRLAADKVGKTTEAQFKASEPYQKIARDEKYKNQISILETQDRLARNRDRINFREENTMKVFDMIAKMDDPDLASAAIESLNLGDAEKNTLYSVVKSNQESTVYTRGQKEIRNNIELSRLLPDQDGAKFLKEKGIIPKDFVVTDVKSEALVSQVLASSISKAVDQEDYDSVYQQALKLGKTETEAEGLRKLAEISGKQARNENLKTLVGSDLISDKEKFGIMKTIFPSMEDANYVDYERLNQGINASIKLGEVPSKAILDRANVPEEVRPVYAKLAQDVSDTRNEKIILNRATTLLENPNISETDRLLFLNELRDDPALSATMQRKGFDEDWINGLGEAKLRGLRKANSELELRNAQTQQALSVANYNNNYRKESSSTGETSTDKLVRSLVEKTYIEFSGDPTQLKIEMDKINRNYPGSYIFRNYTGTNEEIENILEESRSGQKGSNQTTSGRNKRQPKKQLSPEQQDSQLIQGVVDSEVEATGWQKFGGFIDRLTGKSNEPITENPNKRFSTKQELYDFYEQLKASGQDPSRYFTSFTINAIERALNKGTEPR